MVRDELLAHGLWPFLCFSFHGFSPIALSISSSHSFILLEFLSIPNPFLTSPYHNLHDKGSRPQRQDKRCKCHQRWSASLGAPDPPNDKHTNGAGILRTPVILIIYSHIGRIANGPLFPLYPSIYYRFGSLICYYDFRSELSTRCSLCWSLGSLVIVYRYVELKPVHELMC